MTKKSRENKCVRDFILKNVAKHAGDIGSLAGKQFGLSRTAIAGYLKRLIQEGLLEAKGNTKARRYELKTISEISFEIPLSVGLSEDSIWRFRVLPHIKNVKQNIVDICQYGFTEILNNAIDHSASNKALISFKQTYNKITMIIADKGVGIFNKIQKDFNLSDPRSALLELAKGKLTSDKKRHSGEGIFFTSRMFDDFKILSGHLCYSRELQDDNQWLIETEDIISYSKGTAVVMDIIINTNRSTREVFDAYQKDGEAFLAFRKTHVPVKLSKYPNEQLVSRSQAKRLLSRFDNFTEVMLDFNGVHEIGQAFADEIFRVFKNEHTDIKITAVRTTPEIDNMIKYVQRAETLRKPS